MKNLCKGIDALAEAICDCSKASEAFAMELEDREATWQIRVED